VGGLRWPLGRGFRSRSEHTVSYEDGSMNKSMAASMKFKNIIGELAFAGTSPLGTTREKLCLCIIGLADSGF
jgi:hypothetical protein